MAGLKKNSLIIIFCLSFTRLLAQTQDSYDYHSEFTWGINKNTSSGLIGGLVFKKAKKLNDRILETYGLEIINIKHPQEVRRTTDLGNLFLYGKSNYLYALRFQYGRDIIYFKKAPQQGTEIKAVYAVGPSVGIVAPYYVQIGSNSDLPIFQQYDTTILVSNIQGSGRLFELFQGIANSKLKLGLNIKAALNFEFGTVKSQVTGFEVGFLLDAYTSKITMVPTAKNYAIYPTFFIAIFYGRRK